MPEKFSSPPLWYGFSHIYQFIGRNGGRLPEHLLEFISVQASKTEKIRTLQCPMLSGPLRDQFVHETIEFRDNNFGLFTLELNKVRVLVPLKKETAHFKYFSGSSPADRFMLAGDEAS